MVKEVAEYEEQVLDMGRTIEQEELKRAEIERAVSLTSSLTYSFQFLFFCQMLGWKLVLLTFFFPFDHMHIAALGYHNGHNGERGSATATATGTPTATAASDADQLLLLQRTRATPPPPRKINPSSCMSQLISSRLLPSPLTIPHIRGASSFCC